jgi:hypothetical protein
MDFNIPLPMFLATAIGASGGTPSEPEAPEVWTTTFVTETVTTGYIEDGTDPFNDDVTYGHIACNLTGMAEGDVVVIFSPWVSQSGPSLPSYLGRLMNADAIYLNWGTNYLACFGVKRLTAADLLSPPQVPVDGSMAPYAYVKVWAYRGPGNIAIKETELIDAGTTTLPFSGFMKSATHRGLMSLIFCRDGSSNPNTPSGFTGRARITTGSLALEAADILDDSYAGAGFTWTGVTANYQRFGAVVEFLK